MQTDITEVKSRRLLFVRENLEDAERSFGQTDLALQSRIEEAGNRVAAVSAELDQARRGAADSRPVAVLDVERQVVRHQYRFPVRDAATVSGMRRSAHSEERRTPSANGTARS
jgi:hypothetical protein